MIQDVVTALYAFDSENRKWELPQQKLASLKQSAKERKALEAIG
jgi:hypothetical protein